MLNSPNVACQKTTSYRHRGLKLYWKRPNPFMLRVAPTCFTSMEPWSCQLLLAPMHGTAKLNGIDPESYLRNVLSRIAAHPIKRIEELLPWNVTASLQLPNQEAA